MSNIGIYKIENLVNGKLYIGQSRNLRKRKLRHFNELKMNKHVNNHLQRSFNKYGEKNFKFEVILHCNIEDLNYYENFFINLFKTQSTGYNICYAGSVPDNSGKKNGMYGVTPKHARTDIDDNIQSIAKRYENGEPLTHLAREYGIARKNMRTKLRTVFTKEEMDQINKQNQKNPNIKHDNNKGTIHGLEARINMSKSRNSSGYYRVSWDKSRNSWMYAYYNEEGKRRKLSAKTLEKLKQRVLNKNLEWIEY